IQDIADELFGKKAPKRLTARAFVGEPRIGIENIPQLRRAANLLRAEPDGATEEMPYIELTLNVKSLQGKPAVIGHLYYRPAGTNVTCRAARVEEIARLGRVPYALTAAGELLDLSTSRVVDIFTTYYRSHHDSFPELLTLAGLAETSSTRLATDEVRQPLLARIEASRIPVIGKNWSEIVTISETIPHRERIAIASLLKNTLGGSVDAFVYRGRNAVQIGEAKVLGWSNGFWSTLPKILRTGEGLLITLKRSTSNPDRLEIFFFSRPRHQPGTMSTDTNNVVELSRLPLWIKLTTDGQMEDIGAQGTISVDRLFEAQWGVTIVPIGISGNFHIGGNKTRASSYSGLAKIAAAIDPDVTLTYLQEHAIMILHTASSAVSHPHAQLVIPGYLNERIALSSDLYPLFPAHYRHTSGKHSFLLSTILRAQHQAWQAGDANGIRSRFTETHPDLKPAMERRFKNTRLRRAKFRNAEKTAPAATAPVDKKSKEPATPVRVARERPKRQARTLESPAPAHRATPEVVDQTPSAAHPTPDATPAVQAVADTPAPAAPAPGATGGISAQTAASPRTVLVPVSSPMLLSPVDHRSADAAVQLSIVIGATAKPADQLLARALGFLTDGSVLLSHGEHERARILFVRAHNCARSKLAGDTRTIAGDILNIATNALAACDDQIGYACLRIHDGATAEAVIAGLLERRAAAARDLQQLKKNDQVQTLAFFDRYLENIFERLRMYAHDDWFEEARATAQQRIARLTEEITGQGVYRNRFQSSSAHETDLRTRALETRVREESV
ncbi:MAG: hypothetical protein WCG78_06175, partial [Candidatus Omnitrophota bacterium]